MSKNLETDRERLIRLRERQLADRDPSIKQHEFNRMANAREKKVDRRVTAGRVWKTISHAWRGFLVGLFIGILIIVVLPELWISKWALPAALGISFILMVLGIIIGKSFDYRDDLRHLTK